MPMLTRDKVAEGPEARLTVGLSRSPRRAVSPAPAMGICGYGDAARNARCRWQLGERAAGVTLRYPRGRLRRGDRWLDPATKIAWLNVVTSSKASPAFVAWPIAPQGS